MLFNIIWICFCSFSYDFRDFWDEEMLFYVYQKMIVFAFFRDFGTLTRKFKKGTRVGCTLFFIKRKKFKSERSHGHLFGWVNGKLITLKKLEQTDWSITAEVKCEIMKSIYWSHLAQLWSSTRSQLAQLRNYGAQL